MNDYTDQNQDASMEDILASIRKILSSDAENPKRIAPSLVEPLELTDLVREGEEIVKHEIQEECRSERHYEKKILKDLDVSLEAISNTSLMSPSTLSASIATLSALKSATREAELNLPSHTSIEDLAKDLLLPLLKQWVDKNLPALVERIVREEIRTITHTLSK
jgi:cell pole-organizing protein PopZ